MLLFERIGFSFLLFSYFALAERFTPGSEEWIAKYLDFINLDALPMEDPDNPPISKDLVTFHLLSKENMNECIELNEGNIDKIDEKVEKIFVLIHGWLEHRERPWYEDLKNAIFDRYPNSHVIQVDYMEPAFDFYPNAVSAAKYVGQYVGEFLVTICQKRNLSPKQIILIGHSLGSHVSGFSGKTVQNSLSNLGRIIALDPAGPPWENFPCEKRLCASDADTVVALHTDTGKYGYGPPLGTIDFYPNGGETQKGCKPLKFSSKASEDTMCDHWRSWAYMIEALQNPSYFTARKCENFETFQNDIEKCDPVTTTLGDFESNVKGSYYFSTNEKAPFAVEYTAYQKNEL